MELELETISTENIKPSTPTPHHLKYHPLSCLDQLLSQLEYRTPLTLFYYPTPNTTTTAQLLNSLKLSLSKTLSLFYPLAGTLTVDDYSVDCNDEGVPLIVTRANVTLFDFLAAPNRVQLLPRFLPHRGFLIEPRSTVNGWVPLAVQLTIFDCGGVAIGTHVLHNATIDGTSRVLFFKTWAAVAAGRYDDVVAPDLNAAVSVFPPCRGPGPVMSMSTPMVLGPIDGPALEDKYGPGGGCCIVKAFEFSPSSIAALQLKARSPHVPNPTRVEAVSAFLWKHLMAADVTADLFNMSESKKDEYRKINSSVLIHSVNMRPHMYPPLPPRTFGKFITHAIINCDIHKQGIPDLLELVSMLRRVLVETKDNIKFMNMFRGDEGEEDARKHGEKVKKLKQDPNKVTYVFASWSGLDVDFGFGLPVWIGFMGGRVSRWFKNFVPLIQTMDHGIVAWLILDEQVMGILESDPEFLAFVSPSVGSISLPNSLL